MNQVITSCLWCNCWNNTPPWKSDKWRRCHGVQNAIFQIFAGQALAYSSFITRKKRLPTFYSVICSYLPTASTEIAKITSWFWRCFGFRSSSSGLYRGTLDHRSPLSAATHNLPLNAAGGYPGPTPTPRPCTNPVSLPANKLSFYRWKEPRLH